MRVVTLHRILINVILPAYLSWASPARAVDFFWIGPGLGGPGGNFQTSQNWTFNPPPFPLDPAPGGANDSANFDLGRAPENRYTVTNVHGENDRLIVHDDSLTLVVPDVNIGSATDYVLSNETTTSPSLTVGVALADVADVILAGDGGRAIVSTQATTIGQAPLSTGILTIDNNLRLIGVGDLVVGESGTGTLTIQNGAVVASDHGLLGVNEGPGYFGSGTVVVTGTDSSWNTDAGLVVGVEGAGTLSIEAGGSVSSFTGSIGQLTANSTGEVALTGSGSTWTNESLLLIGIFGSGTLTIADGGSVTNTDANMAFNAGSSASVTVTGADSQWNNSQSLDVGLSGMADLTIADGGNVTNTIGRIAVNADSTSAATVTGAGSTWTNSDRLLVGYEGDGTLMISDGGSVSDTMGLIGDRPGGTGTATITGAGSAWANSSSLTVGGDGAGELAIEAGGSVSSGSVFIAGDTGSSGEVTVTGAGSTLTSSLQVTVGGVGTAQLTIFDGGSVSSRWGFIGRLAGSTGTATVAGPGSSWTVIERLSIGGDFSTGDDGGTGTLTVAIGGTVDVSEEIVLFPNGTIRLQQGGTLATTEISFEGGGEFDWIGGTLHVGIYNGNLTNPSGGTLAPGRSAGGTTILGDYAQQAGATIEIEIGGTATATEFDFVHVTGTATLGGELELALISGFLPDPADEFIVFNADEDLLSFFANAGNGDRVFTIDGDGSFLVHYGPTSAFDPNQIVLTDFVPALLGDYNGNGTVDAADYVVWRKTLGQMGAGLAADGNNNGEIDPGDYDVWRAQFGNSALGSGSGADSAISTAVPEPSAAMLTALALVGVAIAAATRRRSLRHRAELVLC